MEFAGIVLLSAALSIDAFNVGASCGFGRIRIPVFARLLILLVSTAVTTVSVFAGGLIGRFMTEQTAKLIGAALLCALGVYMGIGALRGNGRKKTAKSRGGVIASTAKVLADASACDGNSSRRIEPAEALAIGMALSADAFAAGLGFGAGGMGALLPVLCGAFQMLFLALGEGTAARLGRTKRVSERVFGAAAGCVMIIMGILRAVI